MGTINQEEQLQRIAGALEGIEHELLSIASSLEDLSILADLVGCIANTPGGRKFCITGDVTAYEH